jgi:hypothetical protein
MRVEWLISSSLLHSTLSINGNAAAGTNQGQHSHVIQFYHFNSPFCFLISQTCFFQNYIDGISVLISKWHQKIQIIGPSAPSI